jgi:hypothetical protein
MTRVKRISWIAALALAAWGMGVGPSQGTAAPAPGALLREAPGGSAAFLKDPIKGMEPASAPEAPAAPRLRRPPPVARAC